MLSYLVKHEDDLGCVHSIDKLSVVWVYDAVDRLAHKFLGQVLDEVKDLCKMYDLKPETKEFLKPMSAFSWTYHFVKCRFGLPVFIGYQNSGKNGETEIRNVVRIEFNPNKVYDEDNLIDDLIRVLNAFNPKEVRVQRLDYAIDIPVPLEDVVVLQSRKEKRYYKGTIYLGKRMGHGSIKIYDKQAEQNLDCPMTRFEITCRNGHKVKFDNIAIMRGEKVEEEKITSNTKTLVKMCLALKEAGYDYSDFLKGLNSRKRKEVIYYVEGMGQSLVFDDALFENLFKEVVDRLNLGIDFPYCGRYGGNVHNQDDFSEFEDCPVCTPFDDNEI